MERPNRTSEVENKNPHEPIPQGPSPAAQKRRGSGGGGGTTAQALRFDVAFTYTVAQQGSDRDEERGGGGGKIIDQRPKHLRITFQGEIFYFTIFAHTTMAPSEVHSPPPPPSPSHPYPDKYLSIKGFPVCQRHSPHLRARYVPLRMARIVHLHRPDGTVLWRLLPVGQSHPSRHCC